MGDRGCLNSGTWCCYDLRSTALGSHNNCCMLARLKQRRDEYQPIVRAARARLAVTKVRPTTSIIKSDAGYVCPISRRSVCTIAGRASVGWRPCIVVFCHWVRFYGFCGPVGFVVIDEARKGNYDSSHKQNRNGTHFLRDRCAVVLGFFG